MVAALLSFVAGAVYAHWQVVMYEQRVSGHIAQQENAIAQAVAAYLTPGAQLISSIWFKPCMVFIGGAIATTIWAVPLALWLIIYRVIQLKRRLQPRG